MARWGATSVPRGGGLHNAPTRRGAQQGRLRRAGVDPAVYRCWPTLARLGHRRALDPARSAVPVPASRRTWAPERLLADLERLALRAPTRAELFDEAAARLKRTVPFDGACWHTLDPGSDLITQHRLQDLPDRFPVLANNEYAAEDVNKFDQLARAERKAATMNEATGGHPERSQRFRDLLTPAGLGPELRCAFVADGATWGALILVRRAGQPEFAACHVELLANASAFFARAVRRGLIAEACEPSAALPNAPGVVELDASGELIRASSSAEPLLAELSGGTVDAGVRSASIHAVASATRTAIIAAGAAGAAGALTLPSSAVKTPAGTWLVLHGGLLGAPRSRLRNL